MTILSLISSYVTFYADLKNVFVLFVRPIVLSIRPHYHFGKALFEGSYFCDGLFNLKYKKVFRISKSIPIIFIIIIISEYVSLYYQ